MEEILLVFGVTILFDINLR